MFSRTARKLDRLATACTVALAALPLAILLGAGSASLAQEESGGQALPPIKIQLPPPPSFAEPNIPLQYPDGTMSIYGLRKHLDKYLGQQVKVKAYLLEIYQCPVCPKKATCKACDQPHFFMTDEPNGRKDKGLMVADYRMPKSKDPKVTVGKQYVVEGTFARNTSGGFASSDGLLGFSKMVDDSGKEYISPNEELQRKAEAGAASEKAAYEKAMKAKAGQK